MKVGLCPPTWNPECNMWYYNPTNKNVTLLSKIEITSLRYYWRLYSVQYLNHMALTVPSLCVLQSDELRQGLIWYISDALQLHSVTCSYRFRLTDGSKLQIELASSSVAEKDEWIKNIHALIECNKSGVTPMMDILRHLAGLNAKVIHCNPGIVMTVAIKKHCLHTELPNNHCLIALSVYSCLLYNDYCRPLYCSTCAFSFISLFHL